jgi:hypothetical protein
MRLFSCFASLHARSFPGFFRVCAFLKHPSSHLQHHILTTCTHCRIRGVSSHLQLACYHLDKAKPHLVPTKHLRPHHLAHLFATLASSTSNDNRNILLTTTCVMGKKLPSPASDSSLSPVADDLIMQVESKVEVKPASNGKKRKANAVDVKVTTRTKKAKSSGIEKRDTATSTDGIPLSKRTSANRNPIQEGIGHDELLGKEDSDGGSKVTKKKTTTTGRKKQVDLAPLAERTKDTNLLVGAHVSTAGG